ncbi:hypothetical protein MAM1_0424d10447 [Mucor ambiguus]|uniref:DUF2726 domain-containing protein n=1 Tax=Mucor ambiguus TaxID=91626 RepID=A0A0C9N4A6_9FUNG|nr:hypothetical protein MAM1_0424d10447 [Mucor ambiguus]
MLETDGVDKFNCYLNEVEFTHHFVYPLLREILDVCEVEFRLSEHHLQCAAANTDDDERTQSGPKIDIVILHKAHQFAVSICQVSGPNFKTNKNHFLGDRNKLAKNMRAMLNYIENTSPTPNATAFKKNQAV